jgi:RIO kinase 1
VYIIDVSQSVEHDHPEALEFLRMDVANVTAFFRKRGVNVMPMKDLFEFIIHTSSQNEKFEELFDKVSLVNFSICTNNSFTTLVDYGESSSSR